MTNVSIVHEEVLHYRVPFYNQLNDELGGNLTVCSPMKNDALECDQHIFRIKSVGGICFPIDFPRRHLREADLIVMMFNMRWALLYPLLARYNDRLILWGHGVGSRKWLTRGKAKLINRSLGFIAYEPAGCQAFLDTGVPPHKLAYMGNTIEVVDHRLSREKREYFLYVGRLQDRKRLDQLIRAFSILPKPLQQQTGLVILGDGEIRQDLGNLAEECGVAEHCKFVPGSYDANKVKGYLDKAIAYVSPGHVGLGVLHAFSCGVPVITQRVARHAPEVENIVDGVNGLLTGPTDLDIMNAMKTYVTSPDMHDQHCIEAYRRYSEHRTMSMMVTRFHSALTGFSGDLK